MVNTKEEKDVYLRRATGIPTEVRHSAVTALITK